jgi:hypothetical protein
MLEPMNAFSRLPLHASRHVLVVLACCIVAACGSMLPREESNRTTPWDTFDAARASYDRIEPFATTDADLRGLGLDPYRDPNIAILNAMDLLRKVLGSGTLPLSALDAPLRDCLADGSHCRAYQVEVKHIERKREGSFWLDFLTFRRTTRVTGWEFSALIVLKDDLVVYKLWSGQPTIREVEQSTKPLGPLQEIGESLRPR